MSHRSAVTFDTVCLILFVSCVLSSFISVLCFPSVSNFYFTSQYHQFPLYHAAAAASATTAAAAAISLKFHPKHEKRKQKFLTKRANSH
jgi:membrane glycosyltransferase